MDDPFAVLGIDANAGTEEIRLAYHKIAKRIHPDMEANRDDRQAQQRMIELNLAYERAKRLIAEKPEGLTAAYAMQAAEALYERRRYREALLMLERIRVREAAWYDLRGRTLLNLRRAEEAYACFRSAVRMEPGDLELRRHALKAAELIRRQKTIRGKVSGWTHELLRRPKI